jgi:hypothetical protein
MDGDVVAERNELGDGKRHRCANEHSDTDINTDDDSDVRCDLLTDGDEPPLATP